MNEQQWMKSEDPQAMLHCLVAQSVHGHLHGLCYKPSDRKMRLFACACVRQVWPLLTDDALCNKCEGRGRIDVGGTLPLVKGLCPDCKGTGRINRSRNAVEVAERFADGDITVEKLNEARLTSMSAATQGPSFYVSQCCQQQASFAARYTMDIIAPSVRAALLREVFGNPFRPVTLPTMPVKCRKCGCETLYGDGPPLDAQGFTQTFWCKACQHKQPWNPQWLKCPWLTHTVLSLAQAVYDERRPDGSGLLQCQRMLVLSDALEEAGCTDDRLLGELRSAGPHYRGCWAIDLVLGKQ